MNHADTSAALQQAWKKKVQSAPSCFFGFFYSDPKLDLHVMYFFAIIAEFYEQVFNCDSKKVYFSYISPIRTQPLPIFPQFPQRRDHPPT